MRRIFFLLTVVLLLLCTVRAGAQWRYRHGGGRFSGIRIPDVTISPDRIDELIGLDLKDMLANQRHTMRGWRLYIGFRF